MEQSGSELQDLRDEVAETTKEIIKQVARRIELAKRIGQVKSRDSLPIDNERVEDALLEEVLQECKELGLDGQLGTKILATLLAESKKAQRSQGSAKAQPLITPMVMMAKATEIEKKGKKLIRLDVGEPDFHPPKAVLDAVSEALYSYKTYYTVGRGIPELLSALRNYLAKRYAYREAADSQVVKTIAVEVSDLVKTLIVIFAFLAAHDRIGTDHDGFVFLTPFACAPGAGRGVEIESGEKISCFALGTAQVGKDNVGRL